MHTKYDRYRRATADAGQKEITERGGGPMRRVRDSSTCVSFVLSLLQSSHTSGPSGDSKNGLLIRKVIDIKDI